MSLLIILDTRHSKRVMDIVDLYTLNPKPTAKAGGASACASAGGAAGSGGGGALCGYTRARCYSSLKFPVTIGILHIKEIGEGQ